MIDNFKFCCGYECHSSNENIMQHEWMLEHFSFKFHLYLYLHLHLYFPVDMNATKAVLKYLYLSVFFVMNMNDSPAMRIWFGMNFGAVLKLVNYGQKPQICVHTTSTFVLAFNILKIKVQNPPASNFRCFFVGEN